MCGNASKPEAILKQLQTHFKGIREKGVGRPYPRVPAHYTPGNHTHGVIKGAKQSLSKPLGFERFQ